jgi:hypothetical protein
MSPDLRGFCDKRSCGAAPAKNLIFPRLASEAWETKAISIRVVFIDLREKLP